MASPIFDFHHFCKHGREWQQYQMQGSFATGRALLKFLWLDWAELAKGSLELRCYQITEQLRAVTSGWTV